MEAEGAIDLSIKSNKSQLHPQSISNGLFKPIPRPAWSIFWYQTIWPTIPINFRDQENQTKVNTNNQNHARPSHVFTDNLNPTISNKVTTSGSEEAKIRSNLDSETETSSSASSKSGPCPILDIATCDGPVQFERVSNPNFALTVEHHQKSTKQSTAIYDEALDQNSRSYLCIYCNQSFKSLFCYQKHKKRHLNPVSVDITGTIKETNPTLPEKSIHTKDLNVQFFPCKKCGSKFPSYYFVHKHKKLCDKQMYSN